MASASPTPRSPSLSDGRFAIRNAPFKAGSAKIMVEEPPPRKAHSARSSRKRLRTVSIRRRSQRLRSCCRSSARLTNCSDLIDNNIHKGVVEWWFDGNFP